MQTHIKPLRAELAVRYPPIRRVGGAALPHLRERRPRKRPASREREELYPPPILDMRGITYVNPNTKAILKQSNLIIPVSFRSQYVIIPTSFRGRHEGL